MNAMWTKLWPPLEPFAFVLTLIVIVGAAFAIRFILVWIARAIVRRIVRVEHRKAGTTDTTEIARINTANPRVIQRTRTLGSVFSNFVTWTVVTFAILIALHEFGVPVSALITSAGIVGVALAFGTQNIIKDVLSGFLMVAGDQLGVGDEVDLGLAKGTVENVGIRITTLRDAEGVIWFVRNGEIQRIGNRSYVVAKRSKRGSSRTVGEGPSTADKKPS